VGGSGGLAADCLASANLSGVNVSGSSSVVFFFGMMISPSSL
jgi:hypothetical protein